MGKFKLPESGQKMWNDAVKIVMLVLVLAIVFTAASVLPQKAGRGEINPPANAKDFIGMDAETVKIRLEEAGFSKIELIALDDLKFGLFDKEGEVEEVSINGDTSFKKKSVFPKKAAVRIQYHSFPENAEEK